MVDDIAYTADMQYCILDCLFDKFTIESSLNDFRLFIWQIYHWIFIKYF